MIVSVPVRGVYCIRRQRQEAQEELVSVPVRGVYCIMLMISIIEIGSRIRPR